MAVIVVNFVSDCFLLESRHGQTHPGTRLSFRAPGSTGSSMCTSVRVFVSSGPVSEHVLRVLAFGVVRDIAGAFLEHRRAYGLGKDDILSFSWRVPRNAANIGIRQSLHGLGSGALVVLHDIGSAEPIA